jgi:hypothetical protein
MILTLTSVGLSVQAQQRQYNLTDRQMQNLISRIESNARSFRTSMTSALNNSRYNNTRREENLSNLIRDFETDVSQLRTRFNSRQLIKADVEAVLSRSARIDRFMNRNQLSTTAENNWSNLRNDLDDLADAFGINSYWNNDTNNSNNQAFGSTLTGTYRIDRTRSDDVRTVVDRAVRTLPVRDRNAARSRLLARLEPPDMLAIEQHGQKVAIASSRAPQISFQADNTERSERLTDGTYIRVRANLNGDQLSVNSSGNRGTDFNVNFIPVNNGQRLTVSREIYDEQVRGPIVFRSTYDKTAEVAQWNIFGGTTSPIYAGDIRTNQPETVSNNGFIVPNGTRLVAVLNSNVSTKTSKEGDRFTMTVREPSQFQNAVIEGHLSNVNQSGRISGRSELSLNFDQIRLTNGRTYKFEGLLESIKTADGKDVRVDNEGSAEGKSQTQRTVERAAIGSAIGAVIGAIAGGGKGAAIGAIVGAGAGTGSVYVTGRDELELNSGTEVTINASAPENR